MITSKLSSKAQTTILQPIRAAMRLRDVGDPFTTFSEWDSAADRKAFRSL
jgi:antitoxin PrlF